MASDKENNVQRFLDLIKKSKRGKFKIYVGMIAGVGKTYRMLQEAHALLKNGIRVKIGYIETHNRPETHALLEGLPIIPRRQMFYKGKSLEEMDIQAILNERPEVVLVDELAHTNMEGSKNEKRWQDVLEILEAGINVISAVNIQHLESLYEEIQEITKIPVSERIPDSVLVQADEVVNIDLTADELINRLKEGKIYAPDKVETALNNFFKWEHILQLRELALKEVAAQVERKIETEIPEQKPQTHDRILTCISSNEEKARDLIRKTARMANYYNSHWFVLYIQTPQEGFDKIRLDKQRHLINNFKLAAQLGAEVVQVQSKKIAQTIVEEAQKRKISTICIGKPHINLFTLITINNLFSQLLVKLNKTDIDLLILS